MYGQNGQRCFGSPMCNSRRRVGFCFLFRDFFFLLYCSFDLDLPIECDDEYWDNSDPHLRFKQPPNKPSLVTHFILYLRLNQVLAFMLRTIVSQRDILDSCFVADGALIVLN